MTWRVGGMWVGGNMTCRGQPRLTRRSILIEIWTPSLPGLVRALPSVCLEAAISCTLTHAHGLHSCS